MSLSWVNPETLIEFEELLKESQYIVYCFTGEIERIQIYVDRPEQDSRYVVHVDLYPGCGDDIICVEVYFGYDADTKVWTKAGDTTRKILKTRKGLANLRRGLHRLFEKSVDRCVFGYHNNFSINLEK